MSCQTSFAQCSELEIPYDEIDEEIRELVYKLNQVPGIRTLFSCAGHGKPDQYVWGYVLFKVSDFDVLQDLARRLPSLSTIRGGTKSDARVGIAVLLGGEQSQNQSSLELEFNLIIEGFKRHQSKLIREITDLL